MREITIAAFVQIAIVRIALLIVPAALTAANVATAMLLPYLLREYGKWLRIFAAAGSTL